jgi:hypothetical protein
MPIEYESPLFDLRHEMKTLLHSDISNVSVVRGRRIQCSDGLLVFRFHIPTQVEMKYGLSSEPENCETSLVDELKVEICCNSVEIDLPDSKCFLRNISSGELGTTIKYTLFGRSKITDFIRRLPDCLLWSSTVHVVNHKGAITICEFLQHLEFGDSPYSCITVSNRIHERVGRYSPNLVLRM